MTGNGRREIVGNYICSSVPDYSNSHQKPLLLHIDCLASPSSSPLIELVFLIINSLLKLVFPICKNGVMSIIASLI
jgi:hypothetical protein